MSLESGQTEFDERHRAKVSGSTDILQASVSSDQNATVKFGVEQVLTQWSVHAKTAQASSSAAEALNVESSVRTRSAA